MLVLRQKCHACSSQTLCYPNPDPDPNPNLIELSKNHSGLKNLKVMLHDLMIRERVFYLTQEDRESVKNMVIWLKSIRMFNKNTKKSG